MTQESPLDKLVRLSRYVATPEGARRYGKPIHSLITDVTDLNDMAVGSQVLGRYPQTRYGSGSIFTHIKGHSGNWTGFGTGEMTPDALLEHYRQRNAPITYAQGPAEVPVDDQKIIAIGKMLENHHAKTVGLQRLWDRINSGDPTMTSQEFQNILHVLNNIELYN